MASEGAGGEGWRRRSLSFSSHSRLTATDRVPRGAAGGGPAGPVGLGGGHSLGRAGGEPTPLTKKDRNLSIRESKQEGGVTLKCLKRASAVLSTFTPISWIWKAHTVENTKQPDPAMPRAPRGTSTVHSAPGSGFPGSAEWERGPVDLQTIMPKSSQI